MQDSNQAQASAGLGTLPAQAPLANPYVPFQEENPERYQPGCGIIRGTLFPGLDLPLAGQENSQELSQTAMHQLQALGFAINELGLYLDTHRDDSEAVALYNQYVERYEYQMQQLSQEGVALTQQEAAMSGRYEWLNDPWPWDLEG